MAAFAQDKRYLSFSNPVLSADKLLPESFRGTEAISELFEYQVELLSPVDVAITPKDFIGKRATIGVEVRSDGTKRSFNGIISSFEFCGGDQELNIHRAYLVPALWLLTLNTDTRVFQDLTVIEVIKKVLAKYSITPDVTAKATYSSLEYCTQYRETDFNFISRLMEQHGLFYYFKHTTNDHTLVLADNSMQLLPCAVQNQFRYAADGSPFEGFYDFVIQEFASKSTLVTGEHSTWDFRFQPYEVAYEAGKTSHTKGPLGANSHRQYDFSDGPSAYVKEIGSDSNIIPMRDQLQDIRRDVADAETVIAQGSSNAAVLQAGFTMSLTNYPISALNAKYVITRVAHSVQQVPSYRTRIKDTANPYRNTFSAVPSNIVYRSQQTTPKPRVSGMLTGKVVVPDGEDSYMDKYGRVCVQFWWDRVRKPNKTDNTLLRVAQSWAGKGWGTYFWPRVDDEVLIDFLEGDPDAPIVVGSLYNGTNMPKYDPAKQYTRAGILTRSSKNGGSANANELRFEDLKGSEQIFINAERDFDTHVENDSHMLVGNEQHLKVVANQYEEVGGESHSKVVKDRIQEVDGNVHITIKQKHLAEIGADKEEKIQGSYTEEIGQNSNLKVGQSQNEKIGMNYSLQVGQNQYNKAGMLYVVDSGQEVHIKGGMNVVIDGGMGVCLSGPGGFISIDPSGVTIQGILVKINSGGAPLQGSPAVPMDPQAPGSPTAPTAPKWPGDDPSKS